MSNTWSTGVWGQNEWGDQGPIVFELTAPSAATSSVGSILASQVITVSLTAPSNTTSSLGSLTVSTLNEVALTAPSSATTSVGSIKAANFEGWGRQTWGNSAWGEDYGVELSGLSLTSSVGSLQVDGEIGVPLTGVSAEFATPTMSYV